MLSPTLANAKPFTKCTNADVSPVRTEGKKKLMLPKTVHVCMFRIKLLHSQDGQTYPNPTRKNKGDIKPASVIPS